MRRTSMIWFIVAITLLAALLVGCGSSGSGSSVTTAPAETEGEGEKEPVAETEATGEPFVVGMLCSCSGPYADNIGKTGATAKVWEQAVNAAGGIDGHPVKVDVFDDAADPNKALKGARELVEGDHVIAIVGHVSVASPAWEKFVDEKGIPVLGGNPDAASLTDPNFYATGSPLPVMMVGQMKEMKTVGKKHFGLLYCAEAPACAETTKIAEAAAAVVGGVEVSSGKVAVAAPSYTAPCLQMKSEGVDALFVASSPDVVTRVATACAQQSYNPLPTNQSTTYGPEWLNAPNLEGGQIIGPNAPYTDTSIPAVKEFIDAVEKYEPGLTESSQFTPVTMFPWIGGELFKTVVEEAGLTPKSTSAELTEAMYGLKEATLGGLTSPLTYTKGKPFIPACYWAQELNGGELKSLNSGEATCLSTAELKGLGLG